MSLLDRVVRLGRLDFFSWVCFFCHLKQIDTPLPVFSLSGVTTNLREMFLGTACIIKQNIKVG